MRRTAFLVTAALLGLIPPLSSAQTGPGDNLTCQDLKVPLSGLPQDVVLELKFEPADLLKQCKSASGSTLKLVSPPSGITFSPKPGSTHSIPFTVSDDKGRQATAKVLIIRG